MPSVAAFPNMHPKSSTDIGCTRYELNLGCQIRNPPLTGRGLGMAQVTRHHSPFPFSASIPPSTLLPLFRLSVIPLHFRPFPAASSAAPFSEFIVTAASDRAKTLKSSILSGRLLLGGQPDMTPTLGEIMMVPKVASECVAQFYVRSLSCVQEICGRQTWDITVLLFSSRSIGRRLIISSGVTSTAERRRRRRIHFQRRQP